MVIFGVGEACGGKDFSDDIGDVDPTFFGGPDEGGLRQPLLILVSVEDGVQVLTRTVLVTAMVAGPKDFEERLIGGDLRVEIDLDSFRVVANAVVGRVFPLTAAVADPGSDDSWKDPKLGIRRPKSPDTKGGGLEFFIGEEAVERGAFDLIRPAIRFG